MSDVTCETCGSSVAWEDATPADSTEPGDRLLYICPDCLENADYMEEA